MIYSAVQKNRKEQHKGIIKLRWTDSEVETFSGSIGAFNPESETDDEGNVNYTYREVTLTDKESRAEMIAKVIETRFSKDDQIAMLANQGDGMPEHEQEIETFQKFRAFAKGLINEKIL
jgi:uncharacterized protein YfaP (DUF2135 family)